MINCGLETFHSTMSAVGWGSTSFCPGGGIGGSLLRSGRRLLRSSHRPRFGLRSQKGRMRPPGHTWLCCSRGGRKARKDLRRFKKNPSLMPRCGMVILMVHGCPHVMYGLLERSCMRWCIQISLHSTQIATEVRLAVVERRACRTA